MYSTHFSGSILGESILNGKSNLARSSMNENCGDKSGKQIVQNYSVYEEEQQQPPNTDIRNTLANPDPEEEVVVLSPNTLMNKYPIICQICKKGFQRDQNLELHKRAHKLPCNLKKKSQTKKIYLCPIPTCLRHRRSRALGDISGIKKHFLRKHCTKTFNCPKCSKPYAVESDMRAHTNRCGANIYKCDCGSLFQRNDSFNRHKRSCEIAFLAAKAARALTSHSQLVPSSENNFTSETMNNFYHGNTSLQGFRPYRMQHHQLNPTPQSLPPINDYYNQVTSPPLDSAQAHALLKFGATTGNSVPFSTFSSRDISMNSTFSGEPYQNLTINNPSFSGLASPFPSDPQFAGERNVNYTMSQANLQNNNLLGIDSVDSSDKALLQRVNMMDGSSTVGDMNMMMSTMRPLQMAGGGGVGGGLGVTLNVDHSYGQNYYEPPSRNFLGFSALHGGGDGGGFGGGINSSSMGEYGGGMNGYGYGEGGEWAPWMTNPGNEQQHYVNGHQSYNFGCVPSTSTSRISTAGSIGRNSQEE